MVEIFLTKRELIQEAAASNARCIGCARGFTLFLVMAFYFGIIGYSQMLYVDGGFESIEEDEKFGEFTATPAVLISFFLYLILFMQTAKDNIMSKEAQKN